MKREKDSDGETGSTRSRIIEATYHLLMERGYAGASTREIARRARVSKRELYALFDSKEGILAAMIGERAALMSEPLALPEAEDRGGLAEILRRFGISLLREGSRPAVMAIFRLTIAEAERTPDLARRFEDDGRRPIRGALAALLARAAERGLIDGEPEAMATEFLALLWGELRMGLLLRLAEPPSPADIERRAAGAAAALLALHPAISPG